MDLEKKTFRELKEELRKCKNKKKEKYIRTLMLLRYYQYLRRKQSKKVEEKKSPESIEKPKMSTNLRENLNRNLTNRMMSEIDIRKNKGEIYFVPPYS